MPEVHTRHKRHFLVGGELGEEMLDIKAIAGAVRGVTHISMFEGVMQVRKIEYELDIQT